MFDFLKKKISSWIGTDTKKSKKAKKKDKKPKKEKKQSKKLNPKKEKKSKKEIAVAKIKNKIIAEQEKLQKATLPAEEKSEEEVKEESKFLTSDEKETKEEVDEIIEEAQTPLEEQLVPEEVEEEPPAEKTNFFTKLFKKITTTKLSQADFDEIFQEFEMTLLENNVALEAVDKIKENLSASLVGQQIKKSEGQARILQALKDSILSVLQEPPNFIEQIKNHSGIYTIIFFGINGTGKTTSIAKIANLLKKNNISCVLAAGDTFRAASIEQLQVHGKRLEVPVISSSYGSDPASVAFDAKKYASSHGIKVVLIDTAGRMYTKANLLKEMEKMIRIAKPDLKFFVGESITGNDAIDQAKTFNETIGIDGIILSKADIDEKAGTILSVSHITKKPIYFLGTGQGYNDIELFTKKTVLKNLGLE